MSLLAVTDATFESEVLNSDIPVLVEFGTQWCAPCKQLDPILQETSADMVGALKVVQVDVEANPTTASNLGVRGMPTLFLVRNGEIIANKTGSMPKTALRAWIDTSLA